MNKKKSRRKKQQEIGRIKEREGKERKEKQENGEDKREGKKEEGGNVLYERNHMIIVLKMWQIKCSY